MTCCSAADIISARSSNRALLRAWENREQGDALNDKYDKCSGKKCCTVCIIKIDLQIYLVVTCYEAEKPKKQHSYASFKFPNK